MELVIRIDKNEDTIIKADKAIQSFQITTPYNETEIIYYREFENWDAVYEWAMQYDTKFAFYARDKTDDEHIQYPIDIIGTLIIQFYGVE